MRNQVSFSIRILVYQPHISKFIIWEISFIQRSPKIITSLDFSEIRNRKQQLDAMRRVIQLLPQVEHWSSSASKVDIQMIFWIQVNRDTLYVLLNFLHLVAENSEDKKGPQAQNRKSKFINNILKF